MKRNHPGVKLFCVAVLVMCSSWGFLVHRTVNQLAIYQLPTPLQPFFYENMDYLVKHSVRPDQRRSSDPEEATRHFIDFEIYGDSAAWKMPFDWEEAIGMYSKDTLLKYGNVPYHVIIIQNKLTQAFRVRNRDSILFYAADLAHYIGDMHVPLHTTLNYDGQLTNQKGLHSLWESMIPELELNRYNLYSKHKAKYLKNPERAIWAAARHSYTLVDDLLLLEKETSKEFTDSTKYRWQNRNGRESRSYTSAFAKAYSKKLEPTINDQLLRSAELCADFWYTAWIDAGKPSLDGLLRSDKKATLAKFSKEQRIYKKNELLENKLLISRKDQQSGGD
jgi:hypothetical protein